ncbi:MAG: NADH-quinone oxidoreductase subunit C [Oscillospiraceae bacterium]
MQEYKKLTISKEEIIPTAKKMLADGRQLVMIHGYVDDDDKNVVSYDYEIGNCIESYDVTGQTKLPSISSVYSAAAEWPERELYELMGIEFEGLDTSKRLFLPDNMTDGQGQIIVTSLSELREKNIEDKEE